MLELKFSLLIDISRVGKKIANNYDIIYYYAKYFLV